MTRQMYCCAQCFSDLGIKNEIIPNFPVSVGICSYCHSEEQNLIKPQLLRDEFEKVLSIYVEDPNGEPLSHWLKDDWGMFSLPHMDTANTNMLLADILDNGDIVRKKFVPSKICKSSSLDSWENFKSELLCENRFFPKKEIDKQTIRGLLTHLEISSNQVSTTWFRARTQSRSDGPISLESMGAPPNELASPGRANPVGIPYLYVASTLNTAVSEIRPHTGECISIATFCIEKPVDLIDLRNPRHSISPFKLDEIEDIGRLRGDIEFLVQLGRELTKPVLPRAAAIEYLPSQYLCEFIKSCTYDGVIYGSSVSDGINLALFEPPLATAISVEQHTVDRITVESSSFS